MPHLDLPTLTELMQELEQEDPVDYADLPFDEAALRALVLRALVERDGVLQAIDVDQRVQIYLLSTAKLLLENLVLHARLLRLQGQPVDVTELLSKFR